MSIAVDSEVNVYVSDEWLHRINVYSSDGEYLRTWGIQGSGDGELDRPSGLASKRGRRPLKPTNGSSRNRAGWTPSSQRAPSGSRFEEAMGDVLRQSSARDPCD